MPDSFWKVIIIITIAVLVLLAFFALTLVDRFIPGHHHRLENKIVLLPFMALIAWLIRKWRQC